MEHARVPRAVGGQHLTVQPDVGEGQAKRPQELDPPPGRGDQHGKPETRRTRHRYAVLSASRIVRPGHGPLGSGSGSSGIVAWPSWLTPWRRSTSPTVAARMRRSRRTGRWSTYHRSSSSRSSQVVVLRPLICAQPVSPGRTSCRRACSGRIPGQVAHGQRSRPDHAHLAPEHVHQRWQLVDAGRPEQAPEPGQPGLVGLGSAAARPRQPHRPQLDELEGLAVAPGPLLAKQHRPPHAQPHRRRRPTSSNGAVRTSRIPATDTSSTR